MLKIILIDDEEMSRNTLRLMLRKSCSEIEIVSECKNAFEAIEKIKLLKPDLCFLDISMPGKNGINLLKEMREINFEVIFVTAHEKYAIQALRLAAVDYLLKPVDQVKLTLAVNKAKSRLIKKSFVKDKIDYIPIEEKISHLQTFKPDQK